MIKLPSDYGFKLNFLLYVFTIVLCFFGLRNIIRSTLCYLESCQILFWITWVLKNNLVKLLHFHFMSMAEVIFDPEDVMVGGRDVNWKSSR